MISKFPQVSQPTLPKYRDNSRPQHQERWQAGVDCIESGDGEGAVFVYKALANDGCVAALSQIGRIYEHGLAGVGKDFGEAVKWYLRSVETIHDLLSHLALARIYLQEPSLDPDRELALFHLNLLAEHEVMGGYFGLGLVYDFGVGIEEDKDLAEHWFAKAERLGHAGAKLALARNRFVREPARCLLPFIAASINFHWMYFFTKNGHRVEMWDDPNLSGPQHVDDPG